MFIKKLLREQLNNERIFFHGTRSPIPFKAFEASMIGTGIVSMGNNKYGGFFFTDSQENAEFYTEWFIISVKIPNILPDPTNRKHPSKSLYQAVIDNNIYLISDTLDGAIHSDIVVVPSGLVKTVQIINWNFVGDETSYFEYLDNYFGNGEEDEFINQDTITDFFEATGGGLDVALSVPIFKKYYISKS